MRCGISQITRRNGRTVRRATISWDKSTAPHLESFEPEIVTLLRRMVYGLLPVPTTYEDVRRNREKAAQEAAVRAMEILQSWSATEDPKKLIEELGLKLKNGGRRRSRNVRREMNILIEYHAAVKLGATNPATEVATNHRLFGEVTTEKQLRANVVTVCRVLKKWKDAKVSVTLEQ